MGESIIRPELKFENLPDILTVQQTRTILGVGRAAIYRLMKSGQIRHFKIGNAYKIPKASVTEFIMEESSKVGAKV